MASLSIDNVSKLFGSSAAVDGVDLEVESGSFTALLGPSGCGKTTLLRLVAGLERPSGGRIAIGERTVADKGVFAEPEDRGLGMVFQSYALWPHMTVSGNVEFGLKLRRLSRRDRRMRVAEALETVGLSDYAERRPAELSGGQRQRVALARCLALNPPLILLDEPLANLDAHLRGTMQREFRRIHQKTGTTFLYVTHDQSEAMALADRIAVMEGGRLEQIAAPPDLYRRPATPSVARFIGSGFLLPVEVTGSDGNGRVQATIAGTRLMLPGIAAKGPALACLRAEDVTLLPRARSDAEIPGWVVDCTFAGHDYLIDVQVEPSKTAIRGRSCEAIEPGHPVAVAVHGGWVLPAETPA
ncbi:ABC transporter ATP-binding protein [Consotaella aegiceratis]|uniref:ABC transporter ATP-binding protein n=1 Tax=Consotaella aegiceratis TaxID=3097961 RepID=UPI002F427058